LTKIQKKSLIICFTALIVIFLVAISVMNGMIFASADEECCTMSMTESSQSEICLVCKLNQNNREGCVSSDTQAFSPNLNYPPVSLLQFDDYDATFDNLVNLKVRLNN